VGEALGRFGVDLRQTSVGSPYSTAFSLGKPWTPEQRAAFSAWMDRIYANFIARVAEGRRLKPERVAEIAKGRVWTGAQAKQLGLVDKIGGFYDAVEEAKNLAGLSGEVTLRRMSPTESAFQALQKAMGVSATSARTLAAAAWIFGDPRSQAIVDQVTEAKLRGQGGGTVLAPRPLLH
jgi:protease-4